MREGSHSRERSLHSTRQGGTVPRSVSRVAPPPSPFFADRLPSQCPRSSGDVAASHPFVPWPHCVKHRYRRDLVAVLANAMHDRPVAAARLVSQGATPLLLAQVGDTTWTGETKAGWLPILFPALALATPPPVEAFRPLTQLPPTPPTALPISACTRRTGLCCASGHCGASATPRRRARPSARWATGAPPALSPVSGRCSLLESCIPPRIAIAPPRPFTGDQGAPAPQRPPGPAASCHGAQGRTGGDHSSCAGWRDTRITFRCRF